MHRILKALVPVTAAALLSVGLAATAEAAAPKAVPYANCTALNKVYPHGVGGYRWIKDNKLVPAGTKGSKRVAPTDRVAGKTKPVTTWKLIQPVYDRNDGKSPKSYKGEHDLDRDNDGVSCEKK